MKIEDLTLKYDYQDRLANRIESLQIWQTPQGSLYQVRADKYHYFVDTLVSTGWIHLIKLASSEAENSKAALNRWLEIQNIGTAAQVESER